MNANQRHFIPNNSKDIKNLKNPQPNSTNISLPYKVIEYKTIGSNEKLKNVLKKSSYYKTQAYPFTSKSSRITNYEELTDSEYKKPENIPKNNKLLLHLKTIVNSRDPSIQRKSLKQSNVNYINKKYPSKIIINEQKKPSTTSKLILNNREYFIAYSEPKNKNSEKTVPTQIKDFLNEDEINYNSIDDKTLKVNLQNINSIETRSKLSKRIEEFALPLNDHYKINQNNREERKSVNEAIKRDDSSRNSVKSSIQSLREFSENFMTKTKIFFAKKNIDIQCNCGSLPNQNSCVRALKWLSQFEKEEEFPKLKEIYFDLQKEKPEESCANQIEKDLFRTFPNYKYFQKDSEGIAKLRRILVTFSIYEPQIGYVQGMNFLAGNLLYHSEEFVAFWLFVMLFEMFELRDIYLPKLPGLSKHCQLIEILIMKYMPDVNLKLIENCIRVDMFCSPWIFSLFGVLIPMEEMGDFFDLLLKEKWAFVYKFILSFLLSIRHKIVQEDTVGILTLLTENNYKMIEKKIKNPIKWKDLFKESCKITLENFNINKMLSSFDQEKLMFMLK